MAGAQSASLEMAVRGVERVCYAGLDSVALRRQVAERFSRVIPFEAHAFSTCDPDTGLMTHTVGRGIPTALARAYGERLYPDVNAPLSMKLARERRLVYSLTDHSAEARDEFAAAGLRAQVDSAISSGGRLWGIWCVMLGTSAPALIRRGRAALERLGPHLARGLQQAALIDHARASRDDGPDDATGVVVLDGERRVTLRTAAATRWLTDLADVGLSMPDDLPLGVVALAARVRERARRSTPAATVRGRGRSGRWYLLSASLAEPDAHGSCATVITIRPAVPREIASILVGLYDLSPREREVVAAVARGESTKCIAGAFGVSPHTIEEHIDRACAKIGVRGRKALIARLYFDGYAPLISAGFQRAGSD